MSERNTHQDKQAPWCFLNTYEYLIRPGEMGFVANKLRFQLPREMQIERRQMIDCVK